MAAPTPASPSGPKFLQACSTILAEDGKNWLTWSSLVTCILQSNGDAWQVVDKKIRSNHTKYPVANGIAKTIVLNSMAQTLVATYFGNNTADLNSVDIWTTLKARFAQSDSSAKNAFLAQFFSHKYNPAKSAVKNIDNSQQIMQRIAMASATVDEKVACQRLFHSPPASWEGIWLFWSVKADSEQTLTKPYALPRPEAMHREEASAYDPTSLLSRLSIRSDRRGFSGRPNSGRPFSRSNSQTPRRFNNQRFTQQTSKRPRLSRSIRRRGWAATSNAWSAHSKQTVRLDSV